MIVSTHCAGLFHKMQRICAAEVGKRALSIDNKKAILNVSQLLRYSKIKNTDASTRDPAIASRSCIKHVWCKSENYLIHVELENLAPCGALLHRKNL